MDNFDASDFGRYIGNYHNPLILAGDVCNHIMLDSKRLTEYAAEIALKLDCQVGATGNAINDLSKYQGIKVRKAWLAELITALKGEWAEPILSERPDILIFIGYRPEMIDGLLAGVESVGSVHLGPGKSLASERSLAATTFSEWKQNLEALLGAID